jgi:hypothetical protein
MKKHKHYILLTIFFLLNISLFSKEDRGLEIVSFKLHIKISELRDSEPPFIFGDEIIFTYKASKENVRHVGIAFSNEKFSKINTLYKNENGIFFFIYKFPPVEEINYRFIEDGVWVTDLNTPSVLDKPSYIRLSNFKIPSNKTRDFSSPRINGSEVVFYFRQSSGSKVYLTGDFNRWNPFMYPLKEIEDGIFYIKLNLPKGKYGYYFISNGEKYLDSENFSRGISVLGENVSILEIF